MPQQTISHDAEATAPSPSQPLASWYAQGMSDGLGDRLLMFDNSTAPSLELLRFRSDLAQVPEFEAALREQVQRLAGFQHPAFARVRSVKRLEPDDDLALISNYTPGKRLSELLHRARGPELAAVVIRQLAPALAQFHQQNAGTPHGLLSPDRIVVSPEGRLTIVEHVIGPAIDTLDLGLAQLSSMGISLPPASATPRLDGSSDWYQLALVAVSVLIGREVTESELPQLEALLDRVDAAGRDGKALSPSIREWLARALQISGHRIESGADAGAALDELIGKEQPRAAGRHEPSRPAQLEHLAVASAPSAERLEQPVRETTTVRANVPPVTPGPIPDRSAKAPSIPAARFEPLRPDAEAFPSESKGKSDSRPTVMPPRVVPAPAKPAANEESLFEVRAAKTVRQPPPQPRVAASQLLSPFEREVLAGRTSVNPGVDVAVPGQGATMPRWHSGKRKRASRSVLAALAVIAVVEAGVIVWFARPLWLTGRPPLVVEATPSGENVVVRNGSAEAAPMRLTVAPDLGWVRVTTPAAPGMTGGTIRISSPIPLKVLEGDRVVGSVPGADLKISAGRRELELVNTALGYRQPHTIDLEEGETVSLHVAPPPGLVTVEATDGAEVSVDGQAVGRTPLEPLSLALGEHQITFKHPKEGSDRQRVTVKADAPTRVVGKLR